MNFQAMVDAVRRGARMPTYALAICKPARREGYRTRKGRRIICAVMDHKLWPKPRSL